MAEKLAEPVEIKKVPKGTVIKAPEPETPPEASKFETLRRLLGYVTAYKGRLGLIIILSLSGTLLNLAGPYLLGVGINQFVEKGISDGLLTVVLLMVAVAIGSWLILFIRGLVMAFIAQKAIYALRRDLFDHIQTLSLRFYERQPIGELMSRVVNDIESINQFFSNGVSQFLQSTFTLIGVIIAMFMLNIPMSIAVLILIPLMLALIAFTGHHAGPAFTNLQESLGELNGFMEEAISGQKVVKAYGQEEAALKNFKELSLATRRADGKANFLAMLVMPVTSFLSNFDLAVVATVGGWLTIRGVLQIGTVATFLGYTRQFAQPLSQMSQLYNMALQAIAGAERVFEIIDEQPGIADKPDALTLEHADGLVSFKNVNFSYVPGKQILYDNTFEAKPGQMIGLCGPTGAGKSTIINLLTRFYDIQKGDIRVDKHSIYDVQKETLRRRAGIVLQTPFLFSAPVMENLRYGRLDASDEECIEAAKMANAHEFIERLPEGYQTVLAEQGSNLSQGQQQLLTIARTILADPDILVLDEATSSVDTRTEKKIQVALLRLMEGRTSFVIAHRLSTIRDAAQIITLDRGHIVDLGPHDELVAKKGFYYKLYLSQFKQELRQNKQAQ